MAKAEDRVMLLPLETVVTKDNTGCVTRARQLTWSSLYLYIDVLGMIQHLPFLLVS